MIALNGLKTFRTQIQLQAAVLSYIPSQHLPKHEEAEARIREVFNTFDKDQKGEVTKKESMEMLKLTHGNMKRVKKEVEEIFVNLDLDKNGKIGYNGSLVVYCRVLSS